MTPSPFFGTLRSGGPFVLHRIARAGCERHATSLDREQLPASDCGGVWSAIEQLAEQSTPHFTS